MAATSTAHRLRGSVSCLNPPSLPLSCPQWFLGSYGNGSPDDWGSDSLGWWVAHSLQGRGQGTLSPASLGLGALERQCLILVSDSAPVSHLMSLLGLNSRAE